MIIIITIFGGASFGYIGPHSKLPNAPENNLFENYL